MSPQRRKVLFLVHSLQGGGAERVMVQLVNRLDRTKFEPHLAVGALVGPYVDDLAEDVPVHRLGAMRARSIVPALVRTAWAVRPEAIVSTAGFNFAAVAARPLLPPRCALILREANTVSAFLTDVARGSRWRAWAYRRVYRTLYRMAGTVICQSDTMREDLAAVSGLPPQKFTVIPNPVDADRIDALAGSGDAAFAGSGPHLVSAGRHAWQKGYDVLLQAFARVRAEYPHADLTLLGEGEERAKLEAQARALGVDQAVRFLGFQQNPYAFFRRADVYVSPSRYEGLGNAMLEAMACGTPIVATDCSGTRDVIEDGATGWLAAPDDERALAAALVRALRAPRPDAARIRQACESRCGIQHIVPRYEGVLARLLNH